MMIAGLVLFAELLQRQPVGFVWKLSGRVELRVPGAAARRLDARRDRFHLLYAGDRLRVVSGSVQYKFGVKLIPLHAGSGWTTLGRLPRLAAADQDRLEAVFRELEKIAGATRGGPETSIVFPADGSTVRPSHFIVRWSVPPSERSVTVSLLDGDKVIWGPTLVDTPGREVTALALRNALANACAAGDSNFSVAVTTSTAMLKASFRAVSAGQDAALQADLDAVGAENSPEAPARIEELARLRLDGEACDAAWRLWRTDPDSRELTVFAVNILDGCGDPGRAALLRRRLRH